MTCALKFLKKKFNNKDISYIQNLVIIKNT